MSQQPLPQGVGTATHRGNKNNNQDETELVQTEYAQMAEETTRNYPPTRGSFQVECNNLADVPSDYDFGTRQRRRSTLIRIVPGDTTRSSSILHGSFLYPNDAGVVLLDTEVRGETEEGYGIVDQTPAVESFFASIRVPASFLVATSFSQMFASGDDLNNNNSNIQANLQTAYLICQGFTFVLSMNVIVLSSSALVRVLTANFDPFAENAYEMLFRDFHYEFVSVRWSFNVSLYGFLVAVTLKILYQFELLNVYADDYDRSSLELGIAVVLLMVAFYIHLTAYVNQTLIGWNNQYDMTIDLLKILVQRGQDTIREPVSLAVAVVGLIFLILAFIPGAQI